MITLVSPVQLGKGTLSNIGNLQALYPSWDVNLSALATIFVNSGVAWLFIKKSLLSVYITSLCYCQGTAAPVSAYHNTLASASMIWDRSMQSVFSGRKPRPMGSAG